MYLHGYLMLGNAYSLGLRVHPQIPSSGLQNAQNPMPNQAAQPKILNPKPLSLYTCSEIASQDVPFEKKRIRAAGILCSEP